MAQICKYIFDKTINSNPLPTFNSGFEYTVSDTTVDNLVTRTITSDSVPTKIVFGHDGGEVGNHNYTGSGLAITEVLFVETSGLTTINSMFNYCKNLSNIQGLSISTNITETHMPFHYCESLTHIDVSTWDTSNVTNMGYMFSACKNLTSLDVSSFNTEKVTNMSRMFSSCTSLTSLNVSSFNTEKVTNMSIMFYDCKNLTSLDLSNFDTSKVYNMHQMFNGCSNLTSLDVSNFNTQNVTNMSVMFRNCTNLTSLDVSNFDTSNVTSMANMFYQCSKLTSLDLSNFNTSNVTAMYDMFSGCNNLTSLDLSSFNTSKVTAMNGVFSRCTNLTSLNLDNCSELTITSLINNIPTKTEQTKGKILAKSITDEITTLANSKFWELISGYLMAKYTCNTSGVIPSFNDEYVYEVNETESEGIYTVEITSDTDFSSCNFYNKSELLTVEYLKVTSNVTNMTNMFSGCSSLTSLDVSNWNTTNVTSMYSTFNGCNKLTSLDLSNWDTKNVANMYCMFFNCNKLTSLDLSNWDTKNVANMYCMFYGCASLTSLDVSNWDTSKVTNIEAMFQNCQSLTTLDVSNWNTSKVTNMGGMFYGCKNLTSLDVSNFDTTNVTNMQGMFQNCNNLTSLDVSNFNTSNVTNMYGAFSNCTNLTSLDVSNFNTSNVTNMRDILSGCNNLTSLDISNFDTSKVTDMRGLFYNCTSLTSLDLSNFDTSKVTDTSFMFNNCNNLTLIGLIYANIDTLNKLQTPSTATLYIDANIDETAYTGSSKLEVYEQRTVTINIPTALRSNKEIADRIYWNDTDKHYYIEQNINPNTNETLETPNIIASGVKQPIYLKTYENILSVGISNIDASYMSINVPFFEIPTDYEYKWEDELDYIKQSFELRYPDEEDVPNGWGFMNANSMEPCIDVYDAYNSSLIATPLLSTEYFGTNTLSIRTEPYKDNITVFTDGSQTFWSPIPKTITIDEGCSFRINFSTKECFDLVEYIVINDVYYDINTIVQDVNVEKIYADPHKVEKVDDSLGLKVLIDWVDNCTDEEFVADFDKHFLKDYMLRYYCLVILIGAVDNLG